MSKLSRHLRKTLLTGFLAAVPIAVLILVGVWIETHTRPLAQVFGLEIPGIGFVLVLLAVYVLGLTVSNFLGKYLLVILDRLLEHLPGFNLLYHAWKDIVLLPEDRASIFHQVVLVPTSDGKTAQFGFTSGVPIPGDVQTCAVFLPNIPNPLTGRMMLVNKATLIPLKMSAAEAFKFLLSTGNYLPADFDGLTGNHERQSLSTDKH